MLVVGLGNPGARYDRTRHNAGFLVVDELARRHGSVLDRKKFNASIGKATVAGRDVWLVKPQTWMNLSGQSVGPMMGFHHLSRGDVVVAHDDLDLPFGKVRVKVGGGHGGHNGLRDLVTALGGGDFVRVRIGIGRPAPGQDSADYVLQPFAPEEWTRVPDVVGKAADAVQAVVADGPAAAMNRINGPEASPTGAR